MKKVMRNQFVPPSYREKFLERLDRLKQGSKSIKEYHMKLLNLMIKANAEKDDLLSLAIKVEKHQQLLAAWLSSDSIFKNSSKEAKFKDKTKSKVADLQKHHKKKSSNATFNSSSGPVMEEFVEYAVSGDMYVDDKSIVQ
ncbi:hypothetical protein PIB30_101291 [Stylosanthes scabra]|uniref:Retrotransposon gag domain-containing protein n=1 Tax=Stylosanthes scabra TaxID=79078 RepID=A0ABU6XWY3_9FABA|nr:hypothetical protein [Stylosanthes scabra]